CTDACEIIGTNQVEGERRRANHARMRPHLLPDVSPANKSSAFDGLKMGTERKGGANWKRSQELCGCGFQKKKKGWVGVFLRNWALHHHRTLRIPACPHAY